MDGLYGYYGTYLNAVGILLQEFRAVAELYFALSGKRLGSSFSVSCDPPSFATSSMEVREL